ncbi:MAG: hypothetical protein ACE5HI_14555 [bacterium]
MCLQFRPANKATLALFVTIVVNFTNCGSTKQNNQLSQTIITAHKVSLSELANPVSVARFENSPVRFTAKFGGVSSRWDTPEIDQYRYTHYLASLVSEDGNYRIAKVVVPVNERVPLLSTGDLIEVIGIPHLVSETYFYLVVLEVTKKQLVKSRFISRKGKN